MFVYLEVSFEQIWTSSLSPSFYGISLSIVTSSAPGPDNTCKHCMFWVVPEVQILPMAIVYPDFSTFLFPKMNVLNSCEELVVP